MHEILNFNRIVVTLSLYIKIIQFLFINSLIDSLEYDSLIRMERSIWK